MTEAAAITLDRFDAANRTRQDVRDWFAAVLDRHRFLALPTLVGPPPLLGERRISLTVLTMPANWPTAAWPCPFPAHSPAHSPGPIPGFVPGGPPGLSASLQLIGPPGGEEQLVALGRVIEAALNESRRAAASNPKPSPPRCTTS